MMEDKKKQIAYEAVDLGDRMVRFCISKEVQDRDGDILIAEGCDFTNFAKNPQFLGFHDSWNYPLGVPKKWWVDRNTKSVYADVYFPTIAELSTDPANPSERAKLVDFTYNCYKTGLLKAVSVGFRVQEYEKNKETEYGWIIKKWELLEFSAVPVPANQDALMVAAKNYGVDGKKFMDGVAPETQTSPESENNTKAGKRISAATLKILEQVKSCGDEMKACQDKMEKLLQELMIDEPEEEEIEIEDEEAIDIQD